MIWSYPKVCAGYVMYECVYECVIYREKEQRDGSPCIVCSWWQNDNTTYLPLIKCFANPSWSSECKACGCGKTRRKRVIELWVEVVINCWMRLSVSVSYSHTHTHTHTHTQSLYHSITLSLYHSITLSHSPSVGALWVKRNFVSPKAARWAE